ncbi:MAG: PPE domain-containing protein [Candidatus Nitrosocosmicus sp.]|nr:PPE domain-containing protein [Candidatus Nitrosocosmicus sp.]
MINLNLFQNKNKRIPVTHMILFGFIAISFLSLVPQSILSAKAQFSVLPPEIKSAIILAGTGQYPLIVAAKAYTSLALELAKNGNYEFGSTGDLNTDFFNSRNTNIGFGNTGFNEGFLPH